FVVSYGDPRDLTSFPTRRSSDLGKYWRRAGSSGWLVPGKTAAPQSVGARVSFNRSSMRRLSAMFSSVTRASAAAFDFAAVFRQRDRKSTRLNSSHVKISYAVFCL